MTKCWRWDAQTGPGVAIITPEGREWTRVRNAKAARKIVGVMNYARVLTDAIDRAEWDVARDLVAQYRSRGE